MEHLSEKGVAFIELSIIASLMILVLAVACDFTFALKEHAVLTDAARVAARVAVQPTCQMTPVACAENAARDFLAKSRQDPAAYTISASIEELPLQNPDAFTISVSIEGQPLPETGSVRVVRATIAREAAGRFRLPFLAPFRSEAVSTFRVELPPPVTEGRQ